MFFLLLFCTKNRIAPASTFDWGIYFLLLCNKKTTDFYGPGQGTGRMAEKIACGYFLLLRNKKQLISMAAARGRAAWPKK